MSIPEGLSPPDPQKDFRKARKHPLQAETLWTVILPLCSFAALVSLLIPRHEPWGDEAQAWQVARSTSLSDLFSRFLHYEMSPGLWHMLLRAEAAAGLSYNGMHWLTAGFVLVAVCLLLRYSPFPLPLRLALPFTYFLAYQYALVARSYSLCPVLFFLLAFQWSNRRDKPIAVALVLALLANTCAQTCAVSIGFALVLASEAWRGRRSLTWRHAVAAVGLLVSLGFAIWLCRPPNDAPWVVAAQTWSKASRNAALAMHLSRWQRMALMSRAAFPQGFRPARTAAFGGLARPTILAVPLWLSLVVLLHKRQRLRYLLPLFLLVGFGTLTRFSPYHQGMVWLLILSIAWMCWPEKPDRSLRALTVSIALCVAVQLWWTSTAVHDEWIRPYAPTIDVLPVLQTYLSRGKQVVLATPEEPSGGTLAYFSVSVQPYFAEQPFANLTHRFWYWPGDLHSYADYVRMTAQHAAIAMVIQYSDRPSPEELRLTSLGYRRASRACGINVYPRRFFSEELCFTFYEP